MARCEFNPSTKQHTIMHDPMMAIDSRSEMLRTTKDIYGVKLKFYVIAEVAPLCLIFASEPKLAAFCRRYKFVLILKGKVEYLLK